MFSARRNPERFESWVVVDVGEVGVCQRPDAARGRLWSPEMSGESADHRTLGFGAPGEGDGGDGEGQGEGGAKGGGEGAHVLCGRDVGGDMDEAVLSF